MSRNKKDDSLKVFRVMVLGSPESGKTCLCSMLTSHIFFEVYEHTENLQFYMKSVRSESVPTFGASEDLMEMELDEDDLFGRFGEEVSKDSGKKSKSKRDAKKDKKSNKPKEVKGHRHKLKKYGIQLVDVPGEIHETLLSGTKEHNAVERHVQLQTGGQDENSPLLTGRNKSQRSVEKNRLHDDTEPHAFIVLFDATEKEISLKKAINIVKKIQRRKDPPLKDEPILFFGNKMDKFPRSKDARAKVRENAKKLQPILSKMRTEPTKGSKKRSQDSNMYYGSVMRNEVWADSKEDEVMTLDQLLHNLILRCDNSGLGSKGSVYNKRQSELKAAQARKEHDAAFGGGEEHAWCSCAIM